jgi:hypothetical protein
MAQIPCPECGRLARIVDRFTLASTDGPVEHLRIRCPGGHALTPVVDGLWPRAVAPEPFERDEEPVAAPRLARQG